MQGTSVEDGVKTTILVRTDAATTGRVDVRVKTTPTSAPENDFTVELIDQQSGEELEVVSYTGSKSIYIPKNIEREFVIKITAVKGGYTEYICIKPMPQD